MHHKISNIGFGLLIFLIILVIIIFVVFVIVIIYSIYQASKYGIFFNGSLIKIYNFEHHILTDCGKLASFASLEDNTDRVSETVWEVRQSPDNKAFTLFKRSGDYQVDYLSVDENDQLTLTPHHSDYAHSKSSWFVAEYSSSNEYFLKSLFNNKYLASSVKMDSCDQNIAIFAENRSEIYPLSIKEF